MRRGADRTPAAISAVDIALFCTGYGSFLAFYPVGTVGAIWCTTYCSSPNDIPLARCVYFLVLVITMFVWYANGMAGLLHKRLANTVSFVVMYLAFLALLFLGGAGTSSAGIMLCCAVLGVSTATPLLGWYEALLCIHRVQGKAMGFATLVGASFVAGLLAPMGLLVIQGGVSAAVALLLLVAISHASFAVLTRRKSFSTGADASAPARARRLTERYKPSLYVRLTYLTFGMSWALSYCLLLLADPGQDVRTSLVLTATGASIVVSLLLIALYVALTRHGHDRFGLIIRCTVVAAGSLWACMAALDMWWIGARQSACVAVCLLLMLCAIFLNMELCKGYNLRAGDVTASHFVWLLAGIIAGTAIYVPATISGGTLGVLIIESLGTISLFVTVLILPSVSSRATDIANRHLPESEGLDQRIEVNKQALAARYGLTAREEQILGLVTGGYSRKEIARILGVSPNTVKNHLTSIYGKVGVHSIRELSALVVSPGEDKGK